MDFKWGISNTCPCEKLDEAVNFELFTSEDVIVNLPCPSARTFPGRLHSLGVARIKASCPPQAPRRYQAKIIYSSITILEQLHKALDQYLNSLHTT